MLFGSLNNLFFGAERYDLSTVGRYKINNKLNINVDEKLTTLSKEDLIGIIKFRVAQFTGSYRGNHFQRVISKRRKENYFYPTKRL